LKEISLPQLNKNCGIFCNSANSKENVATEVCNVKGQWTEKALELKFCSQTPWKITKNVTTVFKTLSYICSVIFKKRGGKFKISPFEPIDQFS